MESARGVAMNAKKLAKEIVVNAAYRAGLHRLIGKSFAGVGTIFTAHRVVESPERAIDPSQVVTADFLSRCLAHVRQQGCEVIAIDEVSQWLAEKKTGRRFACFTFDDGYRDNLTLALPVFERHGAPMCIFVATGFPDRTLFPWWQALERLVLTHDRVEVRVGLRTERHQARTMAEKRTAYRVLGRLAAGQPEILRSLFASHGIEPDRLLEGTLSWTELAMLATHPLVTIGAHGVTHQALSEMDGQTARDEMEGSKKRLETMLETPVHHFAFPFGACGEREYALAREIGFRTASTSFARNALGHSSIERWSLPRVQLDTAMERTCAIDLHLSGLETAIALRLRPPSMLRIPSG
jgi:peptidoglycan/xylan/chitin deacetylase (PgdA/CDA1 family)